MRQIKSLIKKLIPDSIIQQIKKRRNGIHGADAYEAIKFKGQFFWNAFKALDYNGIDGDYVEFGSHGGKTFKLASDQIKKRNIKRHMWSFDSFEGLPANVTTADKHPKWQEGTMATDVDAFHRICKSNGIPKNKYTAVPGYYEESLTKLDASAAPNNIALAYIDCDMYSSTVTVLNFLEPRLKQGMIIAFDDYFCWAADQISGERKAMAEFIVNSNKWNLVRYRDYGWAGASFVVEPKQV